MYSIPRWFIPMQSKLNFYRYAETLLQTPLANLTEEKVSPQTACILFKWDNPQKLFGFGDKSATYTITHVIENKYGFNTNWAGGIVD